VADVSVQRRALQRAVQIAGSAAALARTLRVPEPALRMWLDGRPIPSEIFLRAVDIIVDDDVAAIKGEATRQRGKEA
jgi:DNA-binding transcriptional regulator YdaS (Cro superfamily)